MKEYDLVKLIKTNDEYLKKNLYKDIHGIALECGFDKSQILFLNEQNQGDYAIIEINNNDLLVEKEKLPNDTIKEIKEKLSLKGTFKNQLMPLSIKEYDQVELLVEDDKYTRFGIHKGNKGFVMSNHAVKNYIDVDFSKIDTNGNYYGDCISVKTDDLKIIK